MGNDSQSGTDQLIYDFMRESNLREDPIIAFTAQGTVMQNSAARRFGPSDLDAIQVAAAHTDPHGRASVSTSLGTLILTVRTYLGNGNRLVGTTLPPPALASSPIASGLLAPVEPKFREPAALVGRSWRWRETLSDFERARATRRPLLVFGEAGTGKTSLALGCAFGAAQAQEGTVVIDAALYHAIGAKLWFDRLRGALHGGLRLVLRGIEVLESRQLTGLRALVRASARQHRIAMTLTATDPVESERYEFLFGAQGVQMPPLRERSEDVEALWEWFSLCEPGYLGARPDTGMLDWLGEYHWPGNLHELQGTVAHVLSRRPRGLIGVTDLPSRIRSSRSGGMMVQAEQDAIQRALIATGGNRTRAAEMLGISRATIYRKAKALGLEA